MHHVHTVLHAFDHSTVTMRVYWRKIGLQLAHATADHML